MSDLQVMRYETSAGAQIFQLPLNAFPGIVVYAYLVLVDDLRVLIDAGANTSNSNQDLEKGLTRVSELIGQKIGLGDLTHIFITHGHIDHYAGLAYIAPKTDAKIGVHDLDLHVLADYGARKAIVSRKMERCFLEGGISPEQTRSLLEVYMGTKVLFDRVDVDFTYESVKMRVGPFKFLHVPGHSAGACIIRLHDLVFTGDHVLSQITPHLGPECLTFNTGLWHYLESLAKFKKWAKGCRLALPGHQEPITKLKERVREIAVDHRYKLERILEHLEKVPDTMASISKVLFGDVQSYNVLLALEEAGAHLEYLVQMGFLGIENLEEVKEHKEPVTLRYCLVREKETLADVFPKI